MFALLRPTDETGESFGEVSHHDTYEEAALASLPGDRIERQDGACSEVVEQC
jgi:hypothetical protein